MARTPVWEQTVDELVRERGDSLFRYAHMLTGDPEDAEDLVQDALARTFGRLRNGFTVESAEAYVRRAILNATLDRGRRAQRWRRIAPLEYRPDEVEGPAGATDRRLDLHDELQKLSPRERACVVLRYYDDLKVDDIAERLGISSGAVKRYLSDGLAKMAIALADDSLPEVRIDGARAIEEARGLRRPRAMLTGGLGGLAVLAIALPAAFGAMPGVPPAFQSTAQESAADQPLQDDAGGAAAEADGGGDREAEIGLADGPFALRSASLQAPAGQASRAEVTLINLGTGPLAGRIETAPLVTVLQGGTVVWSGPEGQPLPPIDVELPVPDPETGAPIPVDLPPLPAGDYELLVSVVVVMADGSAFRVESGEPHPLRVG